MSPGLALASPSPLVPTLACCHEFRGRSTPMSLYARCTSAEQSSPLLGSVLPNTYGVPRYFLAALTTESPVTPVSAVLPVLPVSSVPSVPVAPASVEAKSEPSVASVDGGGGVSPSC